MTFRVLKTDSIFNALCDRASIDSSEFGYIELCIEDDYVSEPVSTLVEEYDYFIEKLIIKYIIETISIIKDINFSIYFSNIVSFMRRNNPDGNISINDIVASLDTLHDSGLLTLSGVRDINISSIKQLKEFIS